MRPHQWLKNLLVLVPFAMSMGELHLRDGGIALLAFVCLCALTSGTYLVNDLFDIEADRRHPRKRNRPIASGDLPVAQAVAIACGPDPGVARSAPACFASPSRRRSAAYLVITLAYSFRLKRMAMVDVLVIAMLFTLRILAGMLLVSEKPSHWLLMFSIFFFLEPRFHEARGRVQRDPRRPGVRPCRDAATISTTGSTCCAAASRRASPPW